MDQRGPHGEVLRRRSQPHEQAILEELRVMDGSLVYVDVDGSNGAVEGEGDLRQSEGGNERAQCHDHERSIEDKRRQTSSALDCVKRTTG